MIMKVCLLFRWTWQIYGATHPWIVIGRQTSQSRVIFLLGSDFCTAAMDVGINIDVLMATIAMDVDVQQSMMMLVFVGINSDVLLLAVVDLANQGNPKKSIAL